MRSFALALGGLGCLAGAIVQHYYAGLDTIAGALAVCGMVLFITLIGE